ncbi:MAG TPA: hypothetical protein VGE00_06845 [Gammaproteobacteria bacterium]
MEHADHCYSCSLNRYGPVSSPFCSSCRKDSERRRYCIAIANRDSLQPFLAIDDENSMRSCSRRLAEQGYPCVILEWSDEHVHYRMI